MTSLLSRISWIFPVIFLLLAGTPARAVDADIPEKEGAFRVEHTNGRGIRDTYIDEGKNDAMDPGWKEFQVYAKDPKRYILIEADLSQIPVRSDIDAAILKIYAFNRSGSGKMHIGQLPASDAWGDRPTKSDRDSGAWSGGNAVNSATRIGTVEVTAGKPDWIVFDIKPAVSSIVLEGGDAYKSTFVIWGEGGVDFRCRSADAKEETERPVVIVQYIPSEGGAVEISTEGMSVEEEKKKVWLDAQLKFAGELGKLSYNNLQEQVYDDIQTGRGWDNKELTPAQASYVEFGKAKVELEVIENLEDPKEKIERAPAVLKTFLRIMASLPAGPLKDGAEVDLVNAYFKLANIFQKEWTDASQKDVANRDGAHKFYTDGMRRADGLFEKISDKFFEYVDTIQDDEQSGSARRAAQTKAEQIFKQRLELQQKMENAYSDWVLLFERGSAERQAIYEKAMEYFDNVAMDYSDFVPDYKAPYISWIKILSAKDDPRGEKDPDGKLISPILEDIPEENDPARYVWPSFKMRFFWKYHFLESRSRLLTDNIKVTALYAYAESMLRMAKGAFAKADAGGSLASEWEKAGEEFLDEATTNLDLLVKQKLKQPFEIKAIAESTSLTVRLTTRVDLWLWLAERAHKKGQAEKAKEYFQVALKECGTVKAQGGAPWKAHVQKRTQEVTDLAAKLQIDIGPSVDAILAEADDLYKQYRLEIVDAKKQELLTQAREKYIEGLEIAKQNTDKQMRANYLPHILTRIGVASLYKEDYSTAYMALFALVREFNPRHYSPADFPAAIDVMERTLNNLRYTAGKLRKTKDQEFYRGLYVDALLMVLARGSEGEGEKAADMVVILINELKAIGMFDDALTYIADVPKTHIYYGTVQLIGAGICQSVIQKAKKRIQKIDTRLNPEDPKKKPTAEEVAVLEKERAELMARRKEYATKAVGYSEVFLDYIKSRPDLPPTADEKQVAARDSETQNIPAAYLIPISIAFENEEYERVIKLSDELTSVLDKIDVLKPEAKLKSLLTARYLKMLSFMRQVDTKQDPMDTVATALDKAQQVLPKIEEIEKQAQAIQVDGTGRKAAVVDLIAEANKNANQAYMVLGGGWNSLGNRAAKAGNAAKNKEYLNRGVPLFLKAEGAIYKDFNLVYLISTIYSSQGMHEQAEGVLDVAIKFYNESQFTKTYMFRPGKTLADFRKASAPGGLSGVDAFGAVKSAGGEDALVQALNDFVMNVNPADHADAFKPLLEQAKGKGDKRLQENIEQGLYLLTRGDLADKRELRFRVNRIVLEASYPDILARTQLMPILPAAAEFDEATGRAEGANGFVIAYSGDTGRRKATILKAIHDPTLVRSADDKQTVIDYLTELDKEIKAASGAKKKRLQKYKGLFTPGLRARIYGVERKGKIEDRNYGLAMVDLKTLKEWDQQGLPTSKPAKLPHMDFIERLEDGLKYRYLIVETQKRYVDALLALKKNQKALVYLKALLELNPDDKELLLATAQAEYEKVKDGDVFGQEEASAFMRARLRVQDVYKRYNRRGRRDSALYWRSKLLLYKIDLAEVLVRHRAGATNVSFETPWTIVWKGEVREHKYKSTASLKELGERLMGELVRFRTRPPKDFTFTDEHAEAIDAMIEKLEEQGYTRPTGNDAGGADDEDESEDEGES